ncbi:glutamate receptor ionotropic, kainate 3-like [Haliotis rubra]|uniref:glutamate receptor ionotropic, kainate 3-like n=1 Tax=Haliotis rubra TaxID=36100 RepID=UPI001EE54E35|nr:glutamate receptor ionotropic, kainate 3-like [Haliotis rubra]
MFRWEQKTMSDARLHSLGVVSLAYLMSSLTCAVNIGFIYHESYNASNVLTTTLPYVTANDSSSPVGIVEIRLADGKIGDAILKVCEQVQNHTIGFVVVSPCHLLTILEGAVGRLDVPVLGIHSDPCHHKATIPSTFRVQPPAVYRYNAITSLVLAGNFIQVTILSDESETQVTHFRSLLSGAFVESSVTYMHGGYNAPTATALLSRVTDNDESTTCLLLMLGEASLKAVSRLLNTTEYNFEDHIAIVVPSSAVSSTHGLEGFAKFRDVLYIPTAKPTSPSDAKSLNTTDAHVEDSFKALIAAISVNLATTDNVTARRCGDSYVNVSSVVHHVTNSLRKLETNSTLFDNKGHNLMGHYNIERLRYQNNTLTSEHVARWSKMGGLDVPWGTQLFRESTKGLGNITLRVGTTVAAPFVMKLPNNTGWEGFCVDILDELAARLNFRYELIQSPDEFWGTVDEDGNWNGVVEMTRKRSVDLGIGPISLTSERERVIDFTKPYMEEGAGIILRRFEDKSSKIFRVFKPFSESVWLAVAGAVLVVGFTLALVNHLSPLKLQQTDEDGEGNRNTEISTSDNIWIVYESYMEQGCEISPPNISGRFILGFWWVFTILMVASYKANLVAFLTVNFVGKPIRNVDDLAEQTVIKPLVKQGSNLYQELQKGETETFRKLWAMVKTAPPVKNNDEALHLVLTGDYALLTDQSQIEFLRMTDCENLMSGETPFNVGGLGFIVPESSPLLEILSFNLIQLQEAGLIGKWRRRWWSPSSMCPTSSQTSTVQSLELESTSGPFLVFAGSTTCALLCLGVECVYFRVMGRGKVCCKSRGPARPRETEDGSSREDTTNERF